MRILWKFVADWRQEYVSKSFLSLLIYVWLRPMNHKSCFAVATLLVSTIGVFCGGATPSIASEGELSLTSDSFENPPASVRPIYRWWLPLAAVEAEQLRQELDEIADAGGGGVEVAAMPVPGDIGRDPAFLRENGFGTPRWTAALETIFTKARERDLRVDLMVGPLWPTALPSVNRINDPAAQQKLVAGFVELAPGTDWEDAPPSPAKGVPSVRTALCEPLRAGDRQAMLLSATGQSIGDTLTIGEGAGSERATISAIAPPETGRCGNVVALAGSVANDHASGSAVIDEAKRTLIAVLAARCLSAGCPPVAGKRLLDPASLMDLGGQVGKDGTLRWKAPSGDAPWYLFGFYQTADGQKLENLGATTPTYVIDHIGKAGATAVTEFYDRSILTPRLRELIRNSAGSSLFEDSYEPEEGLKWTWGFAQEFEKRRGYSIAAALPMLANAGVGAKTGAFDYPDLGERYREDYRQTWSDLYADNHMRPYKRWANSLGMTTRLQVEGGPMEIGDLAALADIPEGENRNFLNNPQLWKIIGIGAQMRAREAPLSTECCPVDQGVWATTAGGKPFSVAQGTGASHGRSGNNANLNWIYKAYAGGANQLIWHGFPYVSTPGGSGPRSLWPGNSMDGNNSFSEAFGPRMPQWPDYRLINDHLARLQLVMRQGRARYDLMIFWHDYGVEGIAPNVTAFTGYPGLSMMPPTTSALDGAGYSYQFVSPAYLNATTVRQARGGVWLPDTLGAKAIIVNDQRVMPLDSLRRISDLARKGKVPLIFVGTTPERVTGAVHRQVDDAKLQRLVAELRKLAASRGSRVRFVSSLDDVPSVLRDLGLKAAAAHISEPSSSAILSVRRKKSGTNYYLLFNQSTEKVRQTIELEGEGLPYELDSWTGHIRRLGLFERTSSGVRLTVTIGANDAKLYALGKLGEEPIAHQDEHALETTGTDVLLKDGALVLRTDRDGEFETKLSSGEVFVTKVSGVQPVMQLGRWTLDRQSWTADASGQAGSDHTLKTDLPRIDIAANPDGRLPNWAEIGSADVAGIGRYSASINLPENWKSGDGALLDLGLVVDTFRIAVNGTEIEPSSFQDTSAIDIGPYLRGGGNEIVVRVATPLRNAVKLHVRSGMKRVPDMGLIGPVVLRPYRETPLSARPE